MNNGKHHLQSLVFSFLRLTIFSVSSRVLSVRTRAANMNLMEMR